MVKKFNYKLPFDWYFCYRYAVDDHNNLRHTLPSIEDTLVFLQNKSTLIKTNMVVIFCSLQLVLKHFDI